MILIIFLLILADSNKHFRTEPELDLALFKIILVLSFLYTIYVRVFLFPPLNRSHTVLKQNMLANYFSAFYGVIKLPKLMLSSFGELYSCF